MINKSKNILTTPLAIMILLFSTSACRPHSSSPVLEEPPPISIEEVLKGDDVLVVLKDTQLMLVDPNLPAPLPVYSLAQDEYPLNNQLFNFQLTPSHQYIVWYSPAKGLIRLDLDNLSTTTIHPSSQWLDKNPYIQLTANPDTIHFIESSGSQLISINLTDLSEQVTTIPYPYGNIFAISPDGSSVIFVSGYGQRETTPSYLLTSISGSDPQEFTTEAPLNKRDLLTWMNDSASILILENEHTISKISSTDPSQKSTFFTLPEESEITSFSLVDNYLYVLSQRYWSIIDINTQQQIGRAPLEIAQELNNPKFFPWHNLQFLIEDTHRSDPDQYSQLWVSNFMGVKKKVLDEYHKVNLSSQTPDL